MKFKSGVRRRAGDIEARSVKQVMNVPLQVWTR
jgi:hypothetical protein